MKERRVASSEVKLQTMNEKRGVSDETKLQTKNEWREGQERVRTTNSKPQTTKKEQGIITKTLQHQNTKTPLILRNYIFHQFSG
jgi:hypothetical protein